MDTEQAIDNNMKNNNLKRDPWGSLSCDVIREFIEKS